MSEKCNATVNIPRTLLREVRVYVSARYDKQVAMGLNPEESKAMLADIDAALETQSATRPISTVQPCPDGITPDGPTCPRCGGDRAIFARGGRWVHVPNHQQLENEMQRVMQSATNAAPQASSRNKMPESKEGAGKRPAVAAPTSGETPRTVHSEAVNVGHDPRGRTTTNGANCTPSASSASASTTEAEALAQWVEKCTDAPADSKAAVAKSIRELGIWDVRSWWKTAQECGGSVSHEDGWTLIDTKEMQSATRTPTSAEWEQTLLDVTNALADSISNTHPYAKIVGQARKLLRESVADPSGDLEILRMALGNTAACLGDALATFNRVVGQDVFKNAAINGRADRGNRSGTDAQWGVCEQTQKRIDADR